MKKKCFFFFLSVLCIDALYEEGISTKKVLLRASHLCASQARHA